MDELSPTKDGITLNIVKNELSIKKEVCCAEAGNSSPNQFTENRYEISISRCPISKVKAEVLDDAFFSEDEGSVVPGYSPHTAAWTKQELDIGPTELQPPDMAYMLQPCKPDPDYLEPLQSTELLSPDSGEFTQQLSNHLPAHDAPVNQHNDRQQRTTGDALPRLHQRSRHQLQVPAAVSQLQRHPHLLAHLAQTAATNVSPELQRPGAKSLFLLLDDNEIVIDTSDKITDTKAAVRRLQFLSKKKKALDFQCNHCAKTYRSKQSLTKHLNKCMDLDRKKTPMYGMLICPYDGCFKTYRREVILDMHIFRTHEDKKYPCTICSRKYGSPVLVVEHMRHMHKRLECRVCNKVLIGGRSYTAHKKTHKELSGRRMPGIATRQNSFGSLRCDKCGKDFNSKFNAERHARICTGEIKGTGDNFTCPHEDCGKTYHKRTVLNLHIMRTHREKDHPCSVCGRKYGSPVLVKEHMRSIHSYRECALCKEGFFGIANMRNHEKAHRDLATMGADNAIDSKPMSYFTMDFNKPKPLQCDNCGKKFAKKIIIAEHLQACSILHKSVFEASDGTFACFAPGCFYVCRARDKLHTHIVRDHEDKRHACTICNKMYSSPSLVAEHAKNLHIYRKCRFCDEGFLGQKNAWAHERTHRPFPALAKARTSSGDAKYHFICDICGQSLHTVVHLRNHLIGKHGFPRPPAPKKSNVKKSIKCELCGVSYKERHTLNSHILRVHLGKKGDIPCLVCGKLFHRNNDLTRHMVTHTRERPEQCATCERRFVNKAALLYHTRLHTGERPYQCDHCGERFLSASRRGNHIRIMHGTRSQCPFCHKSFTSSGAIKKHVRSFHTAEAADGKGYRGRDVRKRPTKDLRTLRTKRKREPTQLTYSNSHAMRALQCWSFVGPTTLKDTTSGGDKSYVAQNAM